MYSATYFNATQFEQKIDCGSVDFSKIICNGHMHRFSTVDSFAINYDNWGYGQHPKIYVSKPEVVQFVKSETDKTFTSYYFNISANLSDTDFIVIYTPGWGQIYNNGNMLEIVKGLDYLIDSVGFDNIYFWVWGGFQCCAGSDRDSFQHRELLKWFEHHAILIDPRNC